MLAPCEVAVKCVLPVIRAMITKELRMRHRLKQVEVASLLGVSQSAISLYGRNMRGRAISLEGEEEVMSMIREVADSLAYGKMQYRDFIVRFCDICRVIRRKGLMCRLHKVFDPKVRVEECELCSFIKDDCL